MKKLLILYSEYSPTIDAIKFKLQDSATIDCKVKAPSDEELKNYNLIVLTDYKSKVDFDAVNIHYSLLPSFDGNEPVKDAIMSGVKVTGITIYNTKSKKIIAQYPVFIKDEFHYDELLQELKYIEQIIYPIVIEKIINKEPVEIKQFSPNGCSCSGGCNSCRK